MKIHGRPRAYSHVVSYTHKGGRPCTGRRDAFAATTKRRKSVSAWAAVIDDANANTTKEKSKNAISEHFGYITLHRPTKSAIGSLTRRRHINTLGFGFTISNMLAYQSCVILLSLNFTQ